MIACFVLILHLLMTPQLDRRKSVSLLQLWFVLFPNCFQEQEETMNVDSDFMSSYTRIKIWPRILDVAHPIPDS